MTRKIKCPEHLLALIDSRSDEPNLDLSDGSPENVSRVSGELGLSLTVVHRLHRLHRSLGASGLARMIGAGKVALGLGEDDHV